MVNNSVPVFVSHELLHQYRKRNIYRSRQKCPLIICIQTAYTTFLYTDGRLNLFENYSVAVVVIVVVVVVVVVVVDFIRRLACTYVSAILHNS